MFQIENTVLLVIDVQGKLASLIFEKEKIYSNIQTIIKGAQILGIPIIWTEQVPEKLGSTIPEIADLFKNYKPISKTTFSCMLNKEFQETVKNLKRKQFLVTGIEAHVCIYQTICDLIQQNYKVQVIADCVSSRTEFNRNFGFERIRKAGATLTTLEMVICELLRSAEHPKFREIMQLIK